MTKDKKAEKNGITEPTVQNDINCVLQLAQDQLEHMERSLCSINGATDDKDYQDSKAALERIDNILQDQKVVIRIHHGLADVMQYPKNVTIAIRDYDTEGSDRHELEKDGSLLSIYGPDDPF